MDAALPGERGTGSLRFQLLDDLPTAILVSGFATLTGGVRPPRRGVTQHADLCAGWATGATILVEMGRIGYPPAPTGPEAPSLDRADDPLASHVVAPLPAHGMRRRRRIDVWEQDDGAAVECFFRDSHVDPDGLETVVHEYTVEATVDADHARFSSCRAHVGVLPWVECPGAVASAERLVGAPVEGLRTWVRDTFVGPSTCTHLNDTLRSLEDVPALLRALRTSA